MLTRAEHYFCRLMEADPVVRLGLIQRWQEREPDLASEVERMYLAYLEADEETIESCTANDSEEQRAR
ncbi:MAG: hypothetical protein ACN6I3_00525 [bacterium]